MKAKYKMNWVLPVFRNLGIAMILVMILTTFSCTDILDKDPIATLDAGSFFKTQEDAEQAINAAYNPLLFNNTNGNYYWAFAILTADEAITGGDGSRAGLVEMEAFSYTPRTEELNNFWKVQYKGINQCNLVLDKIEGIDMSEEVKNRITGEALFLRSYYYFLLTQVFGDVPLYLNILPPEELRIPRSSVSEIYEQIIADCTTAAALLPVSYDPGNIGRATKGAALALRAKTHLYSKNWTAVISTIEEIENLGIYELVDDYSDNFSINNQNNSESVWEIQHANLELNVGNFLNQWWASRKVEGYGFAEAKKTYVESFEAGDPRRAFTVASREENYLGLVYKGSFSSTGHSPVKFIQPDSTATQKADGDINYPAIRYAEVLLWKAEALVELGRLTDAEIPLEQVRARARAQSANPGTALPYVIATTQQQMRDAVRYERKVELGFEMHRFFDLVRWGLASELLEGFVTGKHEVFPLPQIEIDLNNELTQNPGY